MDFALTISISVAAGVSALIAYLPALAPYRMPAGLALLVLVAGLTWFGHGGRLVFAVMTLLFLASAAAVLASGLTHPSAAHGTAPVTGAEGSPLTAVLLSFPVAMALATGTEAPSAAIAQLSQLSPADRRRFARGTLAATFIIVAGLTTRLAGESKETALGVTSLPTDLAGPQHIAIYARRHWAVENRERYVRDFTFRGTRKRPASEPVQRPPGIRNLVTGAFRKKGHANTAASRRYYDRDEQRILALYGYA